MTGLGRLRSEGSLPPGAQLIRIADDREIEAVVVGPVDDGVPEERLLQLLSTETGIGAVVPRVESPHGATLEAGALEVGGVLLRRCPSTGEEWSQLDRVADVDGTTFSYLAVGRDVARAAALRVAPDADEASLIESLLAVARMRGQRIVFDPGWRVVSSTDPESDAVEGNDERSSLLIVTGLVPGLGLSATDESEAKLIESVIEFCSPGQVSLVVLDGYAARDVANGWRARGVEVVLGPRDWGDWFTGHWGQFGQVILGQSALGTGVLERIESTQPQAVKVFFVESLPFRQAEAWATVAPPEESIGARHRVSQEIRDVSEFLTRHDSIWCEQEVDAQFISGLMPSRPLAVIPPALRPNHAPVPFASRSGVAVWAGEGHRVTSGNEEAAAAVLRDLLPELRHRDPALQVKLITDRASPMLAELAAQTGSTLVPTREADGAIRGARLLIDLHSFGTGGPVAIWQALTHRTPFIASPVAVHGLPLPGVGPLGVFGFREDMIDNAWQLLTDERQWTPFSDALDRLAEAKYSAPIRAAAVRNALAQLGVAPREGGHLWPQPSRPDGVKFRPSVQVALRPEGVATPTGELRLEPPDGGERYREWAQRYGPTDELLAALRRIVAGLEYQPTISILMPVYNTDPYALRAAVDSVRDQVYGRWQLCLADDGSTRRETLSLLEEFESDPAISIVHLPGNSGISGATNAALSLAEGEFVAFLDHDDVYKPHALAQVVRWLNADPTLDLIYSDEDKLNEREELIDPHIKPDWSPDHLMSNNYVCHLSVIRRSLVEKVGGLRSEFDGSQDYDLILRITEETHRIAHIPEPLYSWRIIPGSAAADAEAKPYAWHAGRAALADALARRQQPGVVEFTVRPGIYRSRYALPGQPKVSVIIPTKDRKDLLERCVDSIYDKTSYRNFDLTIIDNQSTDPATLGYLARFHGRVIRYPYRFNYPRMMNIAAAQADCDALLFLNNDMEVISSEWMEALLEHAMRPEIGAAGGRLYFGDGRIQHEGIFVGVVGLAANADYAGYWGRGDYIRNSSAVTGACMMIRPTVYSLVGGYDERLRMAYNDVDLCLRIRQAGFDIAYTPYAELYHFESATRSYENPEDLADGPAFTERWHPRTNVDAYYSPLFERDRLFVFAL